MLALYDARDHQHDLLLAQWYGNLHATGEFDQLFTDPAVRPLGGFLAGFRPPRAAFFEADDDGFVWIAWYDPAFRGAFLGFWIRPDRRHTRQAMQGLQLAHDLGFHKWPLLVAATRSRETFQMLLRLGYTDAGTVPGLLVEAEAAHVGWLTKSRWALTLPAWPRRHRRTHTEGVTA